MHDLEYSDAAALSRADIRDLTRLTQHAEAATGLIDMTAVRLARLFERQSRRRACVAYQEGSPVGWVAVRDDWCTGVLTAEQSVFASGSAGLQRAVATQLVERAGRMAMDIMTVAGTTSPPATVQLRFEVPRGDMIVAEALSTRGGRVVHSWKRVRAEIAEVLRRFPERPANVDIRRVQTEDDFAEHHRIRNTCYGELPNDRLLTRDEWRSQLVDEPGSAPEAWLLAYLDGVPAGMLVASLSRAELGAVYISHAATLPEARGAGINHSLNRVALTWALAQKLPVSRYRTEGAHGEGYETIDLLDIWEIQPIAEPAS